MRYSDQQIAIAKAHVKAMGDPWLRVNEDDDNGPLIYMVPHCIQVMDTTFHCGHGVSEDCPLKYKPPKEEK